MDNNIAGKINFKIATIASLVLMLVIMLWVSKDFGINGDEVTQNLYGQDVYSYYSSFGKKDIESIVKDDARIRDANKNVYMYGGLYDLLCATVNKVSPFDPYDTRHFINAIAGFLAILVTARWARWYKNWEAALLTAWFLFLTPRFFGESMNNPKDIPFAMGMAWGSYQICRFVDAFPKPDKKRMLLLILAIGFAINIRSGGLLLIPFLFVAIALKWFYEWRKQNTNGIELGSVVKNTIIVSVLGYIAGLLFWPFGLENPLSNPLASLGELSKFSTGIGMIFDGEHIVSTAVPWYYIPKWLLISTPLIILAGIIASPVLFKDKEYKRADIIFLFFAALFPIFYIIYKKSPLYDGWRHVYFVYPPLVIMGALTFLYLIKIVANNYGKYAIAAVIFIGLALPAKWCIANHPNEVVYFNETVGGVSGAYGYYETDYYMNSIKQAFYKLAKDADLYHTKDTVVIASNAIEPMLHYVEALHNPRVSAVYVRYPSRYVKKWDYAILYTRFIDKEFLQNGFFPPSNAIVTIKADNAPLCAVIKRSPSSDDAYMALQYMDAKDYANAALYFQKSIQEDPKNETVYNSYAIALASTNRIDEAIAAVKEGLKYTPSNIESYDLLAKLYQAKGDMANAQQASMKERALIEEQQGE